jgi:ribosomal protein L40E
VPLIYCDKCGARNFVGANYCGKCGSMLRQAQGQDDTIVY